ncbi:hypothetical protein EG329_011625 [Mollisiaceae sp. DMI_Dod_QoI]|nr:hypothetical protein EG329_011625 [Helotiales sp. DMI_Dod_QoI]
MVYWDRELLFQTASNVSATKSLQKSQYLLIAPRTNTSTKFKLLASHYSSSPTLGPKMPITKDCISPPIEAGPSLLESKQLPPQVTDALDYVSSKLARKRLHLSLIVVRNDIQIPGLASLQPLGRTDSPIPSPFSSTTFKRSPSKSSLSSISDSSSTISASSTASSPTLTRTSSQSSTPVSPNPYGITLMHASTLTAKAEKILRHTIARAEKKFSIG